MGYPVTPSRTRHPLGPDLRVFLDMVVNTDQSVFQFHSAPKLRQVDLLTRNSRLLKNTSILPLAQT